MRKSYLSVDKIDAKMAEDDMELKYGRPRHLLEGKRMEDGLDAIGKTMVSPNFDDTNNCL